MAYDIKTRLLTLSAFSGTYNDGVIISKQLNIDQETMGGDYWAARTSDQVAKRATAGMSLNGFGYTVGGINSAAVSQLSQYNDSTNLWSTKTNMSTALFGVAAFDLGGFGYYAMGFDGSINTNLVSQYNDSANTWQRKQSGGVARRYVAGWNLNGFGYATHGFDGVTLSFGYSSDSNQYNNSTDVWTLKSHTTNKYQGGAGFALNGYGYHTAGGAESGTSSSVQVEQYNDSTNTWSSKASLPVGKDLQSAFTINGFGYSTHGYNGNNGSPTSYNTITQYIDGANIWVTKNSFNTTARYFGHGFNLNGFGYMCDGYTGSDNSELSQYRNSTLFKISGSFKKSNKVPKKILIGANVSGRAVTLPVQLRTDGSTSWQYMTANVDSAIKPGLTMAAAFPKNAQGLYDYEIQVGLPQYFAGVGGGVWTSKSAFTGTTRKEAGIFNLNGYAYLFCGTALLTPLSENSQYNDVTDVWVAKTNSGITVKLLDSFSLNGFGYGQHGFDGSIYSSATSQYNDAGNSWASKANSGTARAGSAGFTLNGYGYSACGTNNTNSSEINQYNDSLDSASIKSQGGTAITARSKLTAFSSNGYGYTTCGSISGGTSSELNQYNDAANTCVTKTNNPTTKYATTSFILAQSGYVLTGTINDTTAVNEIVQYNDAADVWNIKSSLTTTKQSAAGIDLNGYGYCIGGCLNNISTTEITQYVLNDKIPVLTVTLNVEE